MYAGRIVERATTEQIFATPQHPYTWGLLKSIPRLDSVRGEELVPIAGRPPSLINRPSGCHFHPRCPYVQPDHTRTDPRLEPVPGDPGHRVACLLDARVRAEIWTGLQRGRSIEELRRLAGPGTATVDPDPLLSQTPGVTLQEEATTLPSASATAPPGESAATLPTDSASAGENATTLPEETP
jgi:oligopeptide/dipeptide ABC transporter ATP-binding protein